MNGTIGLFAVAMGLIFAFHSAVTGSARAQVTYEPYHFGILEGLAANPDSAKGARMFVKLWPNPAPASLSREISLADRVAYQRAIEEIYWRHRIWPKENPGPKPLLDAIVSQRQIEQKVEEYLRKSQLVADRRGAPITGSELQTEMERMANHTRQPEVLGELFAALGNDPLVIAECLARPILAEHLVREREGRASPEAISGLEGNNHEAIANAWPSAPGNTAHGTPKAFASWQADRPDATYTLPEISVAVDCSDDSWTPTTTVNAPVAREGQSAVWTGSEMIIWGGFQFGTPQNFNTGARYDPATDSWTATSIVNVADARWLHSTVWTGIEMIVWGGGENNIILNSGGKYNPITDTWTATSMVNVPIARNYHTAAWTGSEMIVWGGRGGGISHPTLNTGGRYNPTTDSWTATETMNAPVARFLHTALWTGSDMIIWGGSDSMNYLHTGGRYNPQNDSWIPTGLTNVAPGRIAFVAVWTGNEMIVWGGVDETFNVTNTGGRYNPMNDSWVATSRTSAAPLPRSVETGVWTGSEMIVWGGSSSGPFNDGG